MENLATWGVLAAIVAFVIFLGYRRSAGGYLVFIVVIGLVALFANKFLNFINGGLISRKYTELTGTAIKVDPMGPFSSTLGKLGQSTQHLQFSLIIFLVALFFFGQFVKFISNIFRKAKPEESQKKRRKRVLKNYGLKSMNDIQKFQ